MAWTECDLFRECARKTSVVATNQALGEHTYAAVWSALRNWLVALFARCRGGNLPTFARLAWQRIGDRTEDGTVQLRPVFVPSDAFLRAHLLHAGSGVVRAASVVPEDLEPCDEFSAMKVAIKHSCSLNKDVVFSCTRHLLHHLGEALRTGRPVKVDLGVGVLSSQDRCISFKFNSMYIAHWPATLAAAKSTAHTDRDGRREQHPEPQQARHQPDARGARVDQGAAGGAKGDTSLPLIDIEDAFTEEGCAEAEFAGPGSYGARSHPASPGAVHMSEPYKAPTLQLQEQQQQQQSAMAERVAGGQHCTAAGPPSSRPRPAWGVRVPPPSPRHNMARSPRPGLSAPHGPQQHPPDPSRLDGRPLSPGRGAMADCAAWPDRAGDEPSDVGAAMPIARTIQLALRGPRQRPASPALHHVYRRPSSPGAGVPRPRPASAPRCPAGRPSAAAATGAARSSDLASAVPGPPNSLQCTQPLSAGTTPRRVQLPTRTAPRTASGPLAAARDATSADLDCPDYPSYEAAPMPRRAVASPHASHSASIRQRPPWGAGAGARSRSYVAGEAEAGAQPARPLSAPRLRGGQPAGAATTAGAVGAGVEAVPPAAPAATLRSPPAREIGTALGGEQPAGARSAWAPDTSGAHVLWSPDSNLLTAAAGRAGARGGTRRGVAGLPSPTTWGDGDGAGVAGEQAALFSPPGGVRLRPQGHEDAGDCRQARDSRGRCAAADCGEDVYQQRQHQQRARKPLFLTPQKDVQPEAGQPWDRAGGLPAQVPGVRRPGQRKLWEEDATGRPGGLDASSRAHRDQSRKDTSVASQATGPLATAGAAAAAARGRAAVSLVGAVRALSPAAPTAPHHYNLRYGGQSPREAAAATTTGGKGALGYGIGDPRRQLPSPGRDAGTAATARSAVAGSRPNPVAAVAAGDCAQFGEAGIAAPGTRRPSQPRRGGTGVPTSAPCSEAAGEWLDSRERHLATQAGSPCEQHESNRSGGGSGVASAILRRDSSGGCADEDVGEEDWSSCGGRSSDSFSFGHGYPLPVYRSSSSDLADSLPLETSPSSSTATLARGLTCGVGGGASGQGRIGGGRSAWEGVSDAVVGRPRNKAGPMPGAAGTDAAEQYPPQPAQSDAGCRTLHSTHEGASLMRHAEKEASLASREDVTGRPVVARKSHGCEQPGRGERRQGRGPDQSSRRSVRWADMGERSLDRGSSELDGVGGEGGRPASRRGGVGAATSKCRQGGRGVMDTHGAASCEDGFECDAAGN